MTNFEALLRVFRTKKLNLDRTESEMNEISRSLSAKRTTFLSTHQALHDEIRKQGLASAELISHQGTDEYKAALNKVAELQREKEEALERRIPSKSCDDILSSSSEREDSSGELAELEKQHPPADELGNLGAYVAAVGEIYLLPIGTTIMLFTGLEHVVNKNPFRWGVFGISLWVVLSALFCQFLFPKEMKSGPIKASAVDKSKFKSPSSIALLENAIDQDIGSEGSLIAGLYLNFLGIILAYDIAILIVIGLFSMIAVSWMHRQTQIFRATVKKVQNSANYDITSLDSKVALDSMGTIEEAVRMPSYIILPSSAAAVVAAVAIGLKKEPAPGSGFTYGELQAAQMLPAILSIMTGVSLFFQGLTMAANGARYRALVDGELLKCEREDLSRKLKEARLLPAIVRQENLERELSEVQKKVEQCRIAIRTAESKELQMMKFLDDCRLKREDCQRQYNEAYTQLSIALQQ